MKSTINDVARMANVSKATVSRVLNGNVNVSEDIKNRVNDVIKQLNYRPSSVARSLVSKRTNTVGLILPDIANPFFPLLAKGVGDAASRMGFSVFQCNTENDFFLEYEYINKLGEQRVDGIILISSNLDDYRIHNILGNNIPCVLCDRIAPSYSTFDSVSVDHFQLAYDAVQLLIKNGNEKIVHLGGSVNIESANKRMEGYVKAVEEAGLLPYIRVGKFSFENGYQHMKILLSKMKPDAIFAANDLIALGAIKAIEEKGYRIPQDIEIIGCDDIFISSIYKPMLSTVKIPAYEMGVKSMELLIDRIENRNLTSKNLILEHQIIIRETCIREDKK